MNEVTKNTLKMISPFTIASFSLTLVFSNAMEAVIVSIVVSIVFGVIAYIISSIVSGVVELGGAAVRDINRHYDRKWEQERKDNTEIKDKLEEAFRNRKSRSY